MASSDLRSFFKIIESASSGEAVRDAIIDAAKTLKTSAANAGSLNGVPASEFAIRTEYERAMEDIWAKLAFDLAEALEDDEYALRSENVMTSGNLYTIIGTYLRPAFGTIMHYEIDPKTNMETLAACESYLKTLTDTKKKMIDAVKAKKKIADMNFDFRGLAEIINHIADDIPELEAGNFDKNKVYDAGENYTYYRAYSSIKVNVPDSELKVEGKFDDNHVTHYPPEGKLFSSVSINLPNSTAAKTTSTSGRTGGSTTKPTQSGKSENPEENEEEIKKVDENGLLEMKDIDANGTFVASETDACDGYKMVSVHVKEPKVSGTFKVTFYNGNDPLEEQEVRAYSSAQYSGSIPLNHEDAALEFKGWSPVPVRVTSDMDVYAQFGEPVEGTAGEISDSWDDIVACAGTKYNVGDYKSLTIGSVSDKQYGTLIMEKVGSGHSNSLWCSKTLFRNTMIGTIASWPTSGVRKFLNGEFLEVLSTLSDGATIVNALVPTTIYTSAPWCEWEDVQISHLFETRCEMQTVDEIWIPSLYEMSGANLTETYKTLIHHHLNDRNAGSMEYGPMGINSWSEPFLPNIYGYEQHEKILDMSSAYGGVTISVDGEERYPILTPNTPEKYKKVQCTNTSTYTGYTLRTIKNYGYPNGGGSNIHGYWGISENGDFSGGGDWYPICFAF